MTDVLVMGAGSAGLLAALRAAELSARTTLVAGGEFGGMAANDGPVPVRTLGHASRLVRGARQLGRYGVASSISRPGHMRLRQKRFLLRISVRLGLIHQLECGGNFAEKHLLIMPPRNISCFLRNTEQLGPKPSCACSCGRRRARLETREQRQ